MISKLELIYLAFFKTWTFAKHIAASLLVSTAVFYIYKFVVPLSRGASSIGIIGGADGPTAIFVSSKVLPALVHNLLFVGMLILLMVLYSPIRNWLQALGQ